MSTGGMEQPTDLLTPATRGELATLWVDQPGAPFNVALVCRFEAGPFLGPEGTVDLAAVRAEVVRRAAGIPGLRRRLTGGRPPAWVQDPLRAEMHVDCVVLPAGTQWLDWCAARIMEPLDRGRPLWRAWVVGTTGPEFVLLLVARHVLADGRHGAAILRALLDDPPAGIATDRFPGASPSCCPSTTKTSLAAVVGRHR